MGTTKCKRNNANSAYNEEEKNNEITNTDWIINKQLNCNSNNLEYAIFCTKDNCQKICIGQIKQMLRFRVEEHQASVSKKGDR